MPAIANVVGSWSSSANTLTVSVVKNGTLTIGQRLSAAGMVSGTFIASFNSGTGGAGTYTLSVNQVSSGSSIPVKGLAHYIETDCNGIPAAGIAAPVGAAGNLCLVECSNRGTCDHSTGTCKCFDGFFGSSCSQFSSGF